MSGPLPVLHVQARTIPEGWEKATLATWERGVPIHTQYDKPDDPPSRDAFLVLEVSHPFEEPRIHRAFPGGIEDLEIYRQEVVDGVHDHWIDPAAGKWEYTYHERLTSYRAPCREPVDQLEGVVEALASAPHTRRAQAVTWQAWADMGIADPPCLQRLWFRVFDDQLVLSAHMRSNDAFKAAFMNMYAFTDLQRAIAERLSARLGRRIRPGQYVHVADSYHIYGSYFDEFGGFLKSLTARTFEQRTFRTEDVQPMIEEARQKLTASLEEERRSGRKGI
jgi:thymidylate synthase